MNSALIDQTKDERYIYIQESYIACSFKNCFACHGHVIQELVYLSLKFTNNIVGLAELTVRPTGPGQVAVRANVPDVIPGVLEVFSMLLAGSSEA